MEISTHLASLLLILLSFVVPTNYSAAHSFEEEPRYEEQRYGQESFGGNQRYGGQEDSYYGAAPYPTDYIHPPAHHIDPHVGRL